jgi:hypothetical protein
MSIAFLEAVVSISGGTCKFSWTMLLCIILYTKI